MRTFKEIVDKFEAAANYHLYIQSFGFGSLDRLNDTINQPFPIAWLRPMSSPGITAFGSRTLTFELYILDIPKQTDTDYIQILSDTERVVYDFYTYFYDGQDQQNYTLTMSQCVPLNEAFQDRMAGWVATFDIQTKTDGLTYCNIPH
jgi:hypothetical protein